MTQKADTLLTNAIVLTMDGKLNQYDPGAVAVKGDVIIAVDPKLISSRNTPQTKRLIAGEKCSCPGWSTPIHTFP